MVRLFREVGPRWEVRDLKWNLAWSPNATTPSSLPTGGDSTQRQVIGGSDLVPPAKDIHSCV